MKRAILTAGFLLWASAALAVGVDEQMLPNAAQEAEARAIMKDVRCLVCQNQSIEDSDADLARDLRAIVRERVAAGDDAAGVKSYLTARYGDWVLLRPPFNGRMLALWLAPFLIMLAGGIAIYRRTVRRRTDPPAPLSAEEEARLRILLSEPEDKK